MWEIFSRGAIPFAGVENKQVKENVIKGKRPEPRQCPTDIARIMRSCWEADPHMRPDFKTITQELGFELNESIMVETRSSVKSPNDELELLRLQLKKTQQKIAQLEKRQLTKGNHPDSKMYPKNSIYQNEVESHYHSKSGNDVYNNEISKYEIYNNDTDKNEIYNNDTNKNEIYNNDTNKKKKPKKVTANKDDFYNNENHLDISQSEESNYN